MSVAYQSWEVASGSIVGFNMAIQGNLCTAAGDTLIPENPNYSSCTILSHESFMNAVDIGTDGSRGLTFSNHNFLTTQDTVIRGLSSLSLHHRSSIEDREISPSRESSHKALELNWRTPLASDGKKFRCSAERATGYHRQERVSDSQKSAHHDSGGCKGLEEVSCGDSALQPNSGCSVLQGSNTFRVATRNYIPFYDNYGDLEFYDFPKHALDVVVEDEPFEANLTVTGTDNFEHDVSSASPGNSTSSIDSHAEASVSPGVGLNGLDGSEASLFKESSNFTGTSSPPRKGLSRFYAGKSRSFSCLGDVMSLRDLAKPENPYAKKQRCHVGRSLNSYHPRLPPLQKRAASIYKKPVHNGKSALTLAVTMSTRDNDQTSPGVERCQQDSPSTSRSYSLSDLQKAAERRISLS